MNSNRIRSLISDVIARNAVSIPPYPANAMRLRAMVAGGTFGLTDLGRIVKEDQVLAAAILRAANSAMFRRIDSITTIDRAVSQLGAEEVCRVALAASLGKIAAGQGPLAELRRTAWRQALASAICAGHLGFRRSLNAETTFVCALLHDFGRVIAVAALEEILRNQKLDESMPSEEWTQVIDEVHVDLGLLMGQRWKLSDVILECIACHHAPENSMAHRAYVDIVMACDDIVQLMENCPYLLPHDLERLPGIHSAKEAHALMDALPLIPAYLQRLSETIPDGGTVVPSQVQKPSSFLSEGRRVVDWPVTWVRSNGDTPCALVFVTEDGLSLTCTEPLPEGGVARVRVGSDGSAVEVSGRVLMTAPEGKTHRSEIRLFVIPGVGKAAWQALYERAAIAA